MNHRTYHLPSGHKYRPQSSRRFVVIEFSAYRDAWVAKYRTDVLDRAVQKMQRADLVIDQVEARIRMRDLANGGVAKWVAA
jgi:cupin superfamily acireductone dioxygenase involved in methionine salvage